jgi:adenylate cyclase
METVRLAFRRLYRRLGPRYPRVMVVLVYLLGQLIVLGGVGLLSLYQPMSDRQLLAIVAVSQVLILLDNVFHMRVAFRLLEPAERWLAGDRTPERSAAAWRAIAGLPLDVMREHGPLVATVDIIPVSVFIAAELHLPWYGFFAVLAGALVVLLYGVFARYFATELTLRPVLEDISRALAGRDPEGRTVPLRVKLLAALPAINIITGVVAAGLAQRGHAHLSDLGLDVLGAVVVAFTLSLELTILLSRSILEPISDLRSATEEVGRGRFDVRVPVISNDETGALAASFNRMVAGLDERRRLHEAFGTFVDPNLVERVLAEGSALEGEELEVTVLFLDLRDFTAFAERAGPREVVSHLNGFFELVVPVLVAHGGHANKFIGDGLLGVFGAPEPLPDHADRALAASLEILERVHDTYGEGAIGIGVNSGTVVAGTVGGGGRLEFTVIGDVVNTASRVEAATRATGDELLITEATRARLSAGSVTLEPRAAVALKGKREPVRLFAAHGSVEGQDRPAAAAWDGRVRP